MLNTASEELKAMGNKTHLPHEQYPVNMFLHRYQCGWLQKDK